MALNSTTGRGGAVLPGDVSALFARACADNAYAGKKVLAVFPDHTRSGPVPLMFKAFCDHIGAQAAQLDFLIALGTHPAMTDTMIQDHFGISAAERTGKYGRHRIFNHAWDSPSENTQIGLLQKKDIERISSGLMSEEVPIRINKKVLAYDILAICGPVFPHEVVGFSGGNKYLFPGIAESEIINFFHWLGALITNPKIIGTKFTPVREVVDLCASMLAQPIHAFCYVVDKGKIQGLFAGESREAWSAAADLSNTLHIRYLDKPFQTVLSCAPKMYDDLWTAGKCMYKLEPVVADNGTLIIYAPHVEEISYTHGKILDRIGYHTRDYFAKQMDRFAGVPRGVIAHSTHVRGIGIFENGVERPRITVVLSSRVPEERCKRIHLGYLDPAAVRVADYINKEDQGILYIEKAGETLYKLKDPPEWQR